MSRALIVGIDKYMLGCNLAGCVRDARAYHAILESLCETHLLLDEAATYRNYKEELEWCIDVKPEEWSILIHSGHGTYVDEGYTDRDEYKPGKPGHLKDQAVVLYDSDYESRLWLDDDYAGVIRDPVNLGIYHAGLFDTCFSGGMDRSLRLARYIANPLVSAYPGPIRRFGTKPTSVQGQKHLTLAACDLDETALEAVTPAGQHGAYTWHFLPYLRNRHLSWAAMHENASHDLRMANVSSQHPQILGGHAIRHFAPFPS